MSIAPLPAAPDAEGGILHLAPLLDSDAADGLRAEILDRRGAPLTLDAADVELLGGRCAEVLLAAMRLWSDEGQGFGIVTPSERFAADARLLGVVIDDMARTA